MGRRPRDAESDGSGVILKAARCVCNAYFSSVRPELVEGPFFLSASVKEERCFDKLSTNGIKVIPIYRASF